MSDLTPEAYAAIAAHMNDDHPQAVVAYARHFGNRPNVEGARITAVDRSGITLEVESAGDRWAQRIPFDHELVDRADARATLIAMLETAERGRT